MNEDLAAVLSSVDKKFDYIEKKLDKFNDTQTQLEVGFASIQSGQKINMLLGSLIGTVVGGLVVSIIAAVFASILKH